MFKIKAFCLFLLLSLFIPRNTFANLLQEAIDKADEGSVILLDDGFYLGPINISKPLTIKGKNDGAYVKGNGEGSVINVISDGVVIENLNISGSGVSHESIDSCIAVKNANNVKVLGNKMKDCLFGVNFEMVNRGVIDGNLITSKDFSLGLKGDGIRLWYSHSNNVNKNDIKNVRDVVFWYSSGNNITNNSVTDSRYSVHFMYADRSVVSGNTFRNNSVGIFFMYSHGSKISDNLVVNSSGAFGIGIGFKEVSDCVVENNEVIYNANGFYIDQSPYQPGTINTFTKNKIQYNTVGIQLHGILFPSVFTDNIFYGNIDAIANDTPMTDLLSNTWAGNYWDDYQGFDRDKDGFGDVAYEHLVFADKIMQYKPAVKFFYASPVMSIINFIVKLLPFSDPEILATDQTPRMNREGISSGK